MKAERDSDRRPPRDGTVHGIMVPDSYPMLENPPSTAMTAPVKYDPATDDR
jgi:hypothetical protein